MKPAVLSPTDELILPSLNLLALDDDPDFCQYLEDLLAEDGHQVRAVTDGRDFWEQFARQAPDLILLDMKMGAVQGETVLAEILQKNPNQCVIVITGFPDLASMRATFQIGVFDYISKPFTTRQLRESLARAVAVKGIGQNPTDQLRQRLGHRIKVLRTEHRWGLKELAEQSGISISQLSSIERGIHLPSLEALHSISLALRKKISALLTEIDF
ncbi:MAG: response regulator [Blastocatellia bacterium]|nr:response regulator [Blastocatellia bacterium]